MPPLASAVSLKKSDPSRDAQRWGVAMPRATPTDLYVFSRIFSSWFLFFLASAAEMPSPAICGAANCVTRDLSFIFSAIEVSVSLFVDCTELDAMPVLLPDVSDTETSASFPFSLPFSLPFSRPGESFPLPFLPFFPLVDEGGVSPLDLVSGLSWPPDASFGGDCLLLSTLSGVADPLSFFPAPGNRRRPMLTEDAVFHRCVALDNPVGAWSTTRT